MFPFLDFGLDSVGYDSLARLSLERNSLSRTAAHFSPAWSPVLAIQPVLAMSATPPAKPDFSVPQTKIWSVFVLNVGF